MLVTCGHCGFVFNKKPSKIKKTKNHFCCIDCTANGLRKQNEILLLDTYAKIIIKSNKKGKNGGFE